MRQGLTYEVLGSVRARHDGSELPLGSPQQRVTLALLLLAQGRVVATEDIATALWGEDVPRAARGTIRTYVHRLRRVLEVEGGDQAVVSTGGGYALRFTDDALDLGRFRAHTRTAERARARGDRAGAARELAAALAEWRDEPLADLSGSHVEEERARLAQRRLAVLEELAELELDLGRGPDLLEQLICATEREPLRERLHELLMRALYRAGRQADALAVYEGVRARLGEELGVDPGPGLRELHQRILRADPALLPLPAPAPVPAGQPVPAQLPVDLPVFVGREDELDRVLTALRAEPGGSPGVVVVHGMPGVGKTAFTVRCAHRLAPHFPDGQLYLDLRGFDAGEGALAPEDALWGFLDALGVPTQQLPSRLDALTALFRSVLAERRCLIVLDNARDTRQVLPLLPGSSRSLVLVTSRVDLSGLVAGTGAHTVPLDLLSPVEATEFLARRLGVNRVAAEPAAVADIVDACARLPLALAVVAARAACNPGFGLAAIAEELTGGCGGLDAFASPDSFTDLRSILSWSYQALSPDAARLFRLLSFYPSTDMDVRVGASLTGLSVPRTHALLRELASAHLVSEIRPGWYTWHDLLRAYAAELVYEVDTKQERRAARHRGLQCHVHTAVNAARALSTHQDSATPGEPGPGVAPRSFTGYQDALDWFIGKHQVLLTLVEWAASHGEELQACQLAWAMRHYLDWAGHWHDLDRVNTWALAAAERIGDNTSAGYAHRGLARVHCHHGRHDLAREHLEKALSRFESEQDVLAQGYTRRQAVGVCQLAGDHTAALAEAERALELFRRTGWQSGQGAAQLALAGSLCHLGRAEEALAPGREALTLLEESGELYDVTAALDVLARTSYQLGRYEEAVAYRERELVVTRRMGLRSDFVTSLLHRMVTGALINLAEARYAAGHAHGANAALREGLASLCSELSENSLALGRYHEARMTLRVAVGDVEHFLAGPEQELDEWYALAMKLLHKTVAIAEELGLGAYLVEP
ncbi:DNA-binding SARP family transcriptional activator [Crossiella equi]|uniref:DNA-binding SARP family transcriptional activator n=1 Tax=Crossiella equi TaxID=130796 RepID=A0ABS5A970_9PSEU|nr:BTAD domain-containing putative transcriptional regulator [Crossiella equi]MBP2473115.1 DNA-binding SARP family transcriptional activator [Crossiella equi]